jgi:hypothetical protein
MYGIIHVDAIHLTPDRTMLSPFGSGFGSGQVISPQRIQSYGQSDQLQAGQGMGQYYEKPK